MRDELRLPADETAERAVLGAILVNGHVLAEVADLLRPEDFFKQAHRRIFASCLELWRQGQALDLVSVQAELERRQWLSSVGGVTYLTRLVSEVPTAAHARQYAELVERKARLRSIILAAREAQRAAMADDLEAALEAAGRILDAGVDRGLEPRNLWEVAFETLEAIQERRREGIQHAVPTGLRDLDDRLDGGLWPSDLVIVAARTSTGKTAFLLQIAKHVAKQGKPVLFFSLEQTMGQLSLRSLASETRKDASLMRQGWLSEREWADLFDASVERFGQPLLILDKPRLTVEQMLAQAKVMQRREGLSLVVVDYLQIVEERRTPGQSRAEQVGEISRKLKAMAMELNVPVVAAAQLNRQAERYGRPSLADLRESGAIEQDADVVLMLWRPDEGGNLVRCTIAKQRNGATGELDLVFFKQQQRFECVDQRFAVAGGEGVAG